MKYLALATHRGRVHFFSNDDREIVTKDESSPTWVRYGSNGGSYFLLDSNPSISSSGFGDSTSWRRFGLSYWRYALGVLRVCRLTMPLWWPCLLTTVLPLRYLLM